MRALVVDDHAFIRKYLRELLLQECGFDEVNEAEDGVVALPMLVEERYDLAVVDIDMPRKDGLSLLAEVQEIAPGRRAIVYSALPEDPYAAKAAAVGAQYVSKSASPELLVETILDFLKP